MTNQYLLKLKRLPKKERRSYLFIAMVVLVIAATLTYGPLKIGREGAKLSGWCSVGKENIKHYTSQGMTCGLWRDGDLIPLIEAEGKYNTLNCELICYDCSTESSPRGLKVCSASSQYAIDSTGTPAIDQNTDDPEYGVEDGDDAFILSWASAPDTAYRNEEVSIRVKVKNPDMVRGKMKVQCSMLDPSDNPWMGSISAINTNNCVRGEAYTQTKIITLGPGELGYVNFNPVAPNEVGEYRYFCEAFERCWESGEDAGISSTIKDRYIDVEERPSDYPVVNSDSETGDDEDSKFQFENPFKDLNEWWKERGTLQKFLLVFAGIFFITFLALLIGEKQQPGG